MRSRTLAILALMAIANTGFAAEPVPIAPMPRAQSNSVYRLRTVAAADVANAVNSHVKQAAVTAEPVSNTVFISGTSEERERIVRLVTALDATPPQVVLQMSVLQVPSGLAKEIGLGSDAVSSLTPREVQLIGAVIRREKPKLELMRPTFQVADNQTGHVQSRSSKQGISAKVTPRILPDGQVLLRVEVQASEIVESPVKVAGGKLPAVNTETIETSGKVSDGGTLFVRGPAVKSADGVTSELLFLIQANVTK